MMGYQTVIFDMDGTILDTLRDMWASVNVTLDHFGWPPRTMGEVRMAVGNGAAKLIERMVPPDSTAEEARRALEFYKPYYDAHAQDKTRPYPGVPELVRTLGERGIRVAVVSNKPDESVRQLAGRFFPGLFPVAIGNRAEFQTKPAPDSTFAALKALGADPAAAVYVGDSDVDIATARNAGLPCISVTWGFRDREFLLAHGAATLADTPEELLRAILSGK